jgi:hypothetical protein
MRRIAKCAPRGPGRSLRGPERRGAKRSGSGEVVLNIRDVDRANRLGRARPRDSRPREKIRAHSACTAAGKPFEPTCRPTRLPSVARRRERSVELLGAESDRSAAGGRGGEREMSALTKAA